MSFEAKSIDIPRPGGYFETLIQNFRWVYLAFVFFSRSFYQKLANDAAVEIEIICHFWRETFVCFLHFSASQQRYRIICHPRIRFACYEWRVSTKPHNITSKLLMTDFVIEGYPVICRVDRWRGESRNKFLSSFFVVVVVVDVARKLVNTSHVYVCTFHVNLGPSQSLPCFCLHPGTRLIKLEVWTLCTDVIRLLATVAIRHLGGKRPGLLMRWCAYLGWL